MAKKPRLVKGSSSKKTKKKVTKKANAKKDAKKTTNRKKRSTSKKETRLTELGENQGTLKAQLTEVRSMRNQIAVQAPLDGDSSAVAYNSGRLLLCIEKERVIQEQLAVNSKEIAELSGVTK